MSAQRLTHAERLALFERQQLYRKHKQFGIAPSSTDKVATPPSPTGQSGAKSPPTSRIPVRRPPEWHGPDTTVRLRLRAVHGPDTGAQFALPEGEYIIGRSPDADLRLIDDTVSHQHARIIVTSRRTTLEDLHSLNGSRIGGVELRGVAIVSPGDRVSLGEAELLVEEGDRSD